MRIFTLLFALLTITACNEHSVQGNKKTDDDSLTSWFLQNEAAINREVNQVFLNEMTSRPEDSLWIEKSIVVTQYAPSILGTFAQKVSGRNDCILISYTSGRDTLAPKTITVFTPSDAPCLNKLDSVRLTVSSTNSFIIKKDLTPH